MPTSHLLSDFSTPAYYSHFSVISLPLPIKNHKRITESNNFESKGTSEMLSASMMHIKVAVIAICCNICKVGIRIFFF